MTVKKIKIKIKKPADLAFSVEMYVECFYWHLGRNIWDTVYNIFSKLMGDEMINNNKHLLNIYMSDD